MKKLLLLLVTTSIFLVGCKSKEEKAQEAILYIQILPF